MTKKILVLLLCIFGWISTSFGQYERIHNGDLLFVGLPLDYESSSDTSGMADAIAAATGKTGEINYIHVAILEVDKEGKVWIIDATTKHGVDRHPIDTFLSDFTLRNGELPILDVMRLRHNKGVDQYVSNAKQFLGRGYDVYFLPNNEEKYCSELVRDSYIMTNGKYIFSEAPMNFKSADGTFPPYWIRLFDYIHQPIPQGVPGTNPNGMSKERALKRVERLAIGR